MKLLIQIPCYNEENVIAKTVREIPKKIDGIDKISLLILDDGSKDKTLEITKKIKITYLLKNKTNIGLGKTFQKGLSFFKNSDYDILVNTDADNQYKAENIKDLILPIINDQSDIVIGKRDIENIKTFSFLKKKLQKLGSFVVKIIVGQKISDATSGFRAYNKVAASKIKIFSKFSYTLESLIQASDNNLRIGEISIDTNLPTRPSRLFKSNTQFIYNQLKIIIMCFAVYKPIPFFSLISSPFLFFGLYLIFRFLYYYIFFKYSGLIQSLIIANTFIFIALIIFLLGIIGELIKINRKLLEAQIDKKFEN